ncbi:MAG TPA: TetR/AcrR family transcriptional regulator [Candidatus Limnocylindria bacterium]|nr:TetR/AcrR family transcriptional regulator [Candidatus Limnocylindria bacterium]
METGKAGEVNLPKTERGQKTMERIIRAAEKEFGKKGYHNTAIGDIAARAKVAPGTIYIYFDDKYTLYCHLLGQYGHHIRKTIADATKGCATRLEAERAGLLSFLQQARKNPHMYQIIWESLYINPRLFAAYYESFAARYKAQLDAAGAEVTPMDNTALAYMLMGIANFLGLKYVFFDKGADLEVVADEAVKFLRHGLTGGAPGRE